ncbi:EamA family transporter [Acinetobacter baumannii]
MVSFICCGSRLACGRCFSQCHFTFDLSSEDWEATKVTTYFYLVPVATALEAWLFFAEPITMGTAVGMLTTIIGMVLVII